MMVEGVVEGVAGGVGRSAVLGDVEGDGRR